MKRPVVSVAGGSPTTSRSAFAFGAVTYALSPSTRVTKSTPRCGEGAARRSGMSERRYSLPVTLPAATFLPDRQRGGGPRASMVRPVHTKSAAWRAPRLLSSVIATIIGAWLAAPCRLSPGARRIDPVWWAVRLRRASHCSMPLAPFHWADRLRGARCRVRRTRYGRAGQ